MVSPGSISAWHISAMHSIPPLVTMSSSRSGRRPWSCSWRSMRYSRTLGIPVDGAYCSATAASSRTSRAAISSTSSVGKVAGLGKPPVIDSTPGGLPARIVASSSPPRRRVRRANSGIDPEGQRAGLAAIERRDVLVVVGQGVQRLVARLRSEDRALVAGDALRGLEGGADVFGARDEQAVVVAEHDVSGRHRDAAAGDRGA